MRRSDSGCGDSGAERTGVGRGMIDENAIRQWWEAVGSKLDERGQRLFAAGEVRSAGWGGLAAVSKITGLARSRSIAGRMIWMRRRCRGGAFAAPAAGVARCLRTIRGSFARLNGWSSLRRWVIRWRLRPIIRLLLFSVGTRP